MRMIRMSVSRTRSHDLRRIVALGAALVLAAGMSACSALKSESSSSASAPHTIAPGKTLTVSTSFYPIQYLAEAIATQARILPHVMLAGCTHEPAVRLAERLSARTGVALSRMLLPIAAAAVVLKRRDA